MATKVLAVFSVFAAAAFLGGCTARQGYYAGQAAQQNACSREIDLGDYRRCMERAGPSYEAFLQSEAERKARKE